MRQNNAQIGKIMLAELKSLQYKQQMTFTDSSNEVYEHIQKELAAEIEIEDFLLQNNDYFKSTPTKANRSKNCDKSTSGSKRNEQIRQILQKMVQDLIRRRNLIGTKF